MVDDNSLPLDAIIGGAVGGAVALMLLAALIGFCIGRQRRQRDSRGAHTMALAPALANATPTTMIVADSQPDMYSTRQDASVSTATNEDVYIRMSTVPAPDADGYGFGRIESVYNEKPIDPDSNSSAQSPYMPFTVDQ